MQDSKGDRYMTYLKIPTKVKSCMCMFMYCYVFFDNFSMWDSFGDSYIFQTGMMMLPKIAHISVTFSTK